MSPYKISRGSFVATEITAWIDLNAEISLFLHSMNPDHKVLNRESIRKHGHDLSRDLLKFTFKSESLRSIPFRSVPQFLVQQLLPPTALTLYFKVQLVDKRYRYYAFTEFAPEPVRLRCKSDSLCAFLLPMRDSFLFPFRETVLYGRSCKKLFELLLSSVQFLDTKMNTLIFAKFFDHHYGISFGSVRINGIADNLQVIYCASLSNCHCRVRIK